MSKESDPSRTQLLLGILSFLGVILGILATIFAPIIQDRIRETREPTQMFTVTAAPPTETNTPAPTDTVPPGEPTSTPAPTDTPVPTATFTATAIPPVPIGQDWSQSCISTLWEPYSSKGPVSGIKQDGCYSQPVNGFFANNGSLTFLYEARLSSAEVIGLFAPLPNSSGSVSVKVHLRDLDSSDIWIGLFSGPSIDSQGLLMSIPAGKASERPFVAWQMPGTNKITSTQFLNQGSGYGVKFEYNAGSVRAVVLPNVFATNNYPVSSDQKWLFIGFRASNGQNRIEGSFFDLVVGD